MFPAVIKKYGNRRLYDTEDSRYITLDELADKIRTGTDVRVVDAKSGEDLTQTTLTQIIIEGRSAARLLPVGLLAQLIRLNDDALAEFLGRYVGAALELYLQSRRGAETALPYNPFATLPFAASSALARLFMSPLGWAGEPAQPMQPAPMTPPPGPPGRGEETEVAALRRELDELKRSLGRGRKRR
ncbi:MAG TPA: polyhydroxyalkanoate synthesis regulator DNA-binding domain-containing protein [Kofleriaceae bacterium]|nr:polyhydroxyalkanoate synthesis regulator DNA-binding domain-containing protein [Kofleriaceae bacterium]